MGRASGEGSRGSIFLQERWLTLARGNDTTLAHVGGNGFVSFPPTRQLPPSNVLPPNGCTFQWQSPVAHHRSPTNPTHRRSCMAICNVVSSCTPSHSCVPFKVRVRSKQRDEMHYQRRTAGHWQVRAAARQPTPVDNHHSGAGAGTRPALTTATGYATGSTVVFESIHTRYRYRSCPPETLRVTQC